MGKRSAGILPYRRTATEFEVLLVHPGGPFWAKKDLGAWSAAKGEYDETEAPFAAALREFKEEVGCTPAGEFFALQPRKQPSGKVVSVWAVEFDWAPQRLVSNTFSLEWPPHSGHVREFPEVDKATWFSEAEALRRVQVGQRGFIEELAQRLAR